MAVYDPRGGGNIHIDVALTNVSVGYPNNNLVGDNLVPRVNVQKQSNFYYVFGREAWGTHADLRGPGTAANEIPGLAVAKQNYFAVEHALQIAVTDEERDNADTPFAPDQDGTELITAKILLGREVAIKNLVTTTTNYSTTGTNMTITLAGGQQWQDYVNSNPISDIRTGIRAINSQIFMDPNYAVVPYQVMSTLEDHPDFIERIKYSERAILTPDIIASIFGIPRVTVPSVGINNANPAQAVSLAYLWGKDVVLAWVPDAPRLRQPAFAYEFNWGYGGGTPMVVDRWRENSRKSDVIRCQRRYDLRFAAVDGSNKSIAGYLIKSAIL